MVDPTEVLTPPTLGNVSDVIPCNFTNATCRAKVDDDVDVVADGDLIQAWWNEFDDTETPITGYNACAGSTPGSCDLAPMTHTTRNAAQFTAPQTLQHLDRVCVTVEAINEVGLVSDRAASDCATVDASVPGCTVHIGNDPLVHAESVPYTNTLFAFARATQAATGQQGR